MDERKYEVVIWWESYGIQDVLFSKWVKTFKQVENEMITERNVILAEFEKLGIDAKPATSGAIISDDMKDGSGLYVKILLPRKVPMEEILKKIYSNPFLHKKFKW